VSDPDARRDWGQAELDLALQRDACPACSLSAETERASIAWLAAANLRHPETVGKLVRAGGLCASHWQAVVERADAGRGRAVAMALERVAEAQRDVIQAGVVNAPRCAVCASAARRGDGVLEMVLERLEGSHELIVYERSFGLCQPHLVVALALLPDPRRATTLRAVHGRQLERLARDVVEAWSRGDRSPAHALVRKLAGGA
jgi:hypothetical protein